MGASWEGPGANTPATRCRRAHDVVKADDEGDYSKTRSLETLQKDFQGYQRLVASLGGLLNDAGASAVKAPIFASSYTQRLK
jgi:hypothetical protein